MKKFWIFSYGTLSHPEYIQLLLKRLPEFTEGKLVDYDLFVHPGNSYLFVKPAIGKIVTGNLFKVSETELKIIDLWEDVPLYVRELKEIKTNGLSIQAFVYTQNETNGIPFSLKYQKNHIEILQDINEFQKWLTQQNLNLKA